MSRLTAFFHNADTEFGVFYPKDHLLAIFPNAADADRAKDCLKSAGCAEEDVISATGKEVVQFAEDHMIEDGISGAVMTRLSRLFGTAALYADQDLVAAREGAGFVAVHCPDENFKADVWRSLETRHPLAARYYSFGGVEHLAGDLKS